MKTLLISKDDFSDYVDLSTKVPDSKIETAIYGSQQRYVQDVICKPLYDEIIGQIQNNRLTSKNEHLVCEYITPYLVNRAYSRYLGGANAKSTSGGMTAFQGGENSLPARDIELSTLIKTADSDAQYFENRLVNFLEQNTTTYPKFEDCACKGRDSLRGTKISIIKKRTDQNIAHDRDDSNGNTRIRKV